MSEPRRFRQSMAWLHTWAGLVVGWVLFAVFVTGTASYYREDISRWMRPETTETRVDPATAATLAGQFLARQPENTGGWFIGLPKAEKPLTEVYWWTSFDGPFHHALLDPATGEPTRTRDTQGGDFLYRFHFELALPSQWGRWIVGACAMVLLIALVSGIVTHRRIFADFFTFRPNRSRQRAWLDAHNLFGVLPLPFHLMITYTGLATLAPMLMPWAVQTAYRDAPLDYFVEAGLMPKSRPPSGQRAEGLPLGDIVARAASAGGELPEALLVSSPGDAAATVNAVFEEPHGLTHLHPQIAYDAVSGAEWARNGAAGAATRTATVMYGLHEAHFAAPALRALFFLCGALGAATVASGLVLWTVARAPKGAAPEGIGLRLVRVLNIGTIAGLPAGIAAFFLANRLLPPDLAGRASAEVWAFFGTWAVVAAIGALAPRARAWPAALGLAAAAFLAVVPADLAFVGEARFVAFDVAMLAAATLLILAARTATRPPAALWRSPPTGAVEA
ncbi:PepSY-associated TM helix domain-containing protein [Methylobacterium sp. J-076]|uniref:PepSY-associated TM helix domain-containing protein n=1 Tax=Methylobacterium sp. J-076 TaxID=2836655 RepID=UPI001FBB1095|nr:PepSY-associated TM helix domain-containing protein [Methylobacterium sp. J-076]MCJ2012359.1 PepSY domain-containing protein [Methylobacterium sp. J-076]